MYQLTTKQKITEADIKQLHHLFYQQINEQQAGKYRTQQVTLSSRLSR
jgi:fido (protein-threonine AMPylation protein)